MTLEFTKNQQEIVDKVREYLLKPKDERTNLIMSGRGGVGKEQPDDTLIPTPDGWRFLKDLSVGDYVFGADGKPTKVVGVFPQGEKVCYSVKLANGKTTKCGIDHLWQVHSAKNSVYIKTLKELLMDYETISSRGDKVHKWYIKTAPCLELSEKQFDIDPYVIGCFLGDGCCLERYLSISGKDEELFNEISRLTGFSWFDYGANNFTINFKANDGSLVKTSRFFEKYPQIQRYSYDKEIPNEYLQGSKEQRIRLLQGLFDTDGSARRERNGIRYCSSSFTLINQVRNLIFSLGYFCGTICEDKRTEKYTKSHFLYYNKRAKRGSRESFLSFKKT